MKEIMAVIRLNKIGETKQALLEENFPSFTGYKVMGRGKAKVSFELVAEEEAQGNVDAVLAEEISEAHRLVPKRLIDLIVHDDDVQRAVDAIIRANSTGHPGDGKIFILPVAEAFQVRTGESGEAVV
ncbi:P-II family nitrogen regulator [Ethanoligenens harbinense]|uniref:Nitrogen regulatory protein P-II n=1 Tax=Ethanoligenens harbinense (strain DSM 18485 / JCM 12961 / CGMCC 1.5033 / YUAN-3) TaxID=663278 RepID=E6U882_ETHHY|nr:P-II family nitrogen regulator [Ethanoligenens harbinense]ADU27101.1 nitrogen regulatory protein P-II [Ethanoligenens harbinense YUAN-3]AVQ96176.1 P-II family nitrogen regulator [Ethanoligenens harbinense YUAN-3]AYF38836.1 P-II family nitrogen regulator [Ethanoligenens harbinense]AYF41586.1 P-II family nitrogen regulator [Ethanoligenens harbinense]QCN92417.1 P-II family nitrogen regulator [Ethanoligenens harbinense]